DVAVVVVCLLWDEIFFHHEPILMAVEPASMVWVAAQRGPDRPGESWEKVVAEWPRLEYVIADGGKGIERGVRLADEARPGQVQELGADVRPPPRVGRG